MDSPGAEPFPWPPRPSNSFSASRATSCLPPIFWSGTTASLGATAIGTSSSNEPLPRRLCGLVQSSSSPRTSISRRRIAALYCLTIWYLCVLYSCAEPRTGSRCDVAKPSRLPATFGKGRFTAKDMLREHPLVFLGYGDDFAGIDSVGDTRSSGEPDMDSYMWDILSSLASLFPDNTLNPLLRWSFGSVSWTQR